MNSYGSMYQSPYQQYGFQMPALQPNTNTIWVDGRSGANMYPVQNGYMVTVFDRESNRFFVKTVDANGNAQRLRSFRYEEEIEEEKPIIDTSKFVTRDELIDIVSSVINEQQQSQSQPQPHQNNNQGRNGGKNGKPVV